MKFLVGLAPIVILSGCQLLGDPECLDILAPGIRITLVDSISGEAVVGVATARDGEYVDSAGPGVGVMFLAMERSGTYRVEANAIGYARWTQDQVRVRRVSGGCDHVKPVDLWARMQPISGRQ